MRKEKSIISYLLKLMLSILLLSSISGKDISPHPAIALIEKVNGKLKENRVYVNPYVTNLYASYILLEGSKEDYKVVKNYVLWYLSKLNYPDKYGLTGTIYNHIVFLHSLKEIATMDYDSVDSYSAAFLILLWLLVKDNKDNYILVKENLNKIKDIAYTIATLQDKDGLTKALPNSDNKYLVDNIETSIALKLFGKILKEIEDSEWIYYYNIGKKIDVAIYREFVEYNGNKIAKIAWAKGLKKKHWIKDKNRLYPDMFAEIMFDAYTGREDLRKIPYNFSREQKINLRIISHIRRQYENSHSFWYKTRSH